MAHELLSQQRLTCWSDKCWRGLVLSYGIDV